MIRRSCLLLILGGAISFAQDTFPEAPKIVAVGDVHGDYDQFVTVLRDAGVIDSANKWAGGKTHLVQTGDVLDRGPHSRKAMDLLMELENQARKASGRVHALLGNHEAMNVYGDLRYVSAGEYKAFETSKSRDAREKAMKASLPEGAKIDDAYRTKWEAEHPLGWVEHRLAYGPEGEYGRWVRKKNAVLKIGDTLFLHGGIGPKYASTPLKEINGKIRSELQDFQKLEGGIAMDPEGPLWYRGLAQDSEAQLAAHVDQVLAVHGVRRIVIGHTVGPAIRSRFGGKVLLIDVGLSSVFGGPAACLVLEGGQPRAMHRGKLAELAQ